MGGFLSARAVQLQGSEIPLVEYGDPLVAQALHDVNVSLVRRSWLGILRPQVAHVGVIFLVFLLAGVAMAHDLSLIHI